MILNFSLSPIFSVQRKNSRRDKILLIFKFFVAGGGRCRWTKQFFGTARFCINLISFGERYNDLDLYYKKVAKDFYFRPHVQYSGNNSITFCGYLMLSVFLQEGLAFLFFPTLGHCNFILVGKRVCSFPLSPSYECAHAPL
jgi:hypothetical protein